MATKRDCLASCAFNSLIGLSSVSFPASVALLVALFFALIGCDLVLGDRKTRAIVNVLDVPAGFALRYINIFFTPAFVLLPLSPPISGVVIGFVITLSITAYLVRGLQLLLGSSKRAVTERAEEMGDEDDAIPLADTSRTTQEPETTSTTNFSSLGVEDPYNDLVAPPRTQDPSLVRGTGGPPETDTSLQDTLRRAIIQAPLPLTRPQRWAAFINSNFDRLTYAMLFLLVGLPIYFTTGYAMPAQLSFNVLAYFAALALPVKWSQFLHPVLVSSLITVCGIWILGLVRGENLDDVLDSYKTGASYLKLWDGNKHLPLPGAGDIFGSVLDASIVALALPMYNYRQELQRHFFAIVIPNVVVSIASLFGYPYLCYAIGMSSKRSLAFAARSLTLALATPAVSNLGGDLNTVAALAIMSGILGVLIGPKILALMRIPEDDYVTRGVTLGANSSAIATARLLVSDPRAAALSSLSMSLFGIITLALTSVPPIVKAIGSSVDL
ncbi:Uncharacterized protein D0Z07_6771 [Hyphodiscus hymeniophilus]|uniref:LrgB-like protein n=1 Tax=Hyphodiscus hymeniophilus TaxID=353542 RepID=A0A9P6VGN2_9HELO|nr:Uncharacterized protein D0Z07_6771 [Hyphodiscus hymeniophilus]